MPDISMCENTACPKARECYRNPKSGTRPDKYHQAWFVNLPFDPKDGCGYFWQVREAEVEKDLTP